MSPEERAARFRDWYDKEMYAGRMTKEIALARLAQEFREVENQRGFGL